MLVLARVAIGAPAPAEQATLAPGVESAIMLPNSGGTMQVYLPSNYTATQKWATVFFYHYMGGTPDTSFLRGLTEGRDYIVAGMSYLDDARPASPVQDTESYMRRELANYRSARNWLIAHASVDEARIFLAGTSKGGWAASGLGELELPRLGGIIILLAGRPYGFGRSPSPDALHGKPIYIGTGETDPNNMAARLARELYRRNGAVVTFEEYAGRGHEVPSDEKRLRAWLEANGPRRDRLSQPADRKELSAEIEKSRAAAMAEADPSTQYSRLLDLADDPRLPLCEAGVSAQIQRQLAALRGRPPEADAGGDEGRAGRVPEPGAGVSAYPLRQTGGSVGRDSWRRLSEVRGRHAPRERRAASADQRAVIEAVIPCQRP